MAARAAAADLAKISNLGLGKNTLAQISVREPLRLSGLRFRDLFQWLSSSMKSVSRSTPGTDVPLTNPAVPGGWASV